MRYAHHGLHLDPGDEATVVREPGQVELRFPGHVNVVIHGTDEQLDDLLGQAADLRGVTV